MPFTLRTKTVYHCKCANEDCLWEWDADELPERCARCKRFTWNGTDDRFNDPKMAFLLQQEKRRKKR